jgi:type I restriction enzyme S subunit
MTSLVRLGDIAAVFNGKTPSKAEQRSEGHPVLKIRDVDDSGTFKGTHESFVEDGLAKKFTPKWIQSGDTLVLNAAHNADYVGSKTFFAQDSVAGALATGEWLIVRPAQDQAIPAYVNFWLRSKATREAIRFVVKGIHLYPKDVAALDIPLPPLAEQRRIVDLLARAEGIVRLRRQAQQKAAELFPALFLDLFGDPATNPKRWPSVRIGDLVERFEGGKNVQAGNDDSARYRILKISAVTSGRYDESESKPAPDDLTPRPEHIVKTGDLLISRANTEALVGATAMVKYTYGRTLLPDKLWRFVWRDDAAIEPIFMLHLLQQPGTRSMLSRVASGTGGSMKNISQTKLKELYLPIPPLAEQRIFIASAERVSGIATLQSTALAKSQSTFDALLYGAFAVQ